MAHWVKGTVANTDDAIWLNLDFAIKIERKPGLTYTSIEFSGPAWLAHQEVSETPEQLLKQGTG
jgi:hypothetical protein